MTYCPRVDGLIKAKRSFWAQRETVERAWVWSETNSNAGESDQESRSYRAHRNCRARLSLIQANFEHTSSALKLEHAGVWSGALLVWSDLIRGTFGLGRSGPGKFWAHTSTWVKLIWFLAFVWRGNWSEVQLSCPLSVYSCPQCYKIW